MRFIFMNHGPLAIDFIATNRSGRAPILNPYSVISREKEDEDDFPFFLMKLTGAVLLFAVCVMTLTSSLSFFRLICPAVSLLRKFG